TRGRHDGERNDGLIARGAFFTRTTSGTATTLTTRYTSRPRVADENAPDAAFPERVQTGYRSRTRDLAPSKDSWFLHLEGPQGVSGPYRVKNTPVVAGSETVWVLILHEDS